MAVLTALILCTAFIARATAEKWVTVKTAKGTVRGTSQTVFGSEVSTFWGIPYAEPPVGSKRFKAPEVKARWDGVLDATKKPAACFQNKPPPLMEQLHPAAPLSEDCLYLNVWSPSARPDKARAVMVWIHGGGYIMGASTSPQYNGVTLAARKDVVVVTLNYRLTIFGFLYLGTQEEAPGNMGLMDQQMALQWVQENIASFHGDSSRVTLFGESAGAVCVQLHMMCPNSEGLFNNAIMESGTALADWAIMSRQEAREAARATISSLECIADEGYQCLMSMNAQTLTAATSIPTARFAPVVDKNVIPGDPKDLLESGRFKKTNILIGTNRDEGTVFIPLMVPGMTDYNPNKTVSRTLYDVFGKMLLKTGEQKILESLNLRYGVPEINATSDQLVAAMNDMITDTSFVCPLVTYVETMLEYDLTAYEYLYAHVSSLSPHPDWLGVMHGMEVGDVFGYALRFSNSPREEKDLSELIMSYWTNFAKTGDPNRGGDTVLPEWRPHNNTEHYHIMLQTPEVALIEGHRQGRCKFMIPLMFGNEGAATSLHSRGSGTILPWNAVILTMVLLTRMSLRFSVPPMIDSTHGRRRPT